MSKWKNPGVSKNSKFRGLYDSWCNMHQRAGNKNGYYPTYSDVSVCERWNSYDNFFEDMSNTWFEHAQLDKDIIKPDNRVYCKEYCKWVNESENIREKVIRVENPMKRPEIVEKFKGSNSSSAKKVKCIETNEIFNSTIDAANKYNLIKNAVCKAANPNDKYHTTAGGYHWQYL